MKLSKRMEMNAAMITPGNILADVGTDHGYIPIYMVENNYIPRAFAMDLRKGPLMRAEENIAAHGLKEQICTRLSDGVQALAPGEAETILIAGMGGELVISILTAGENVCHAAKELVIQAQSDLDKLRMYLVTNGYMIDAEDMVCEDGKYYTVMHVLPQNRTNDITTEPMSQIEQLYGANLLHKKHPVLKAYLEKQHGQLCAIYNSLKTQGQSEKTEARIEEVANKIALNEQAQMHLNI